MKTFNWHFDQSHEWMEVELEYLKIRGLASKISSYSYYSTKLGKAYLEGDMDASILINSMGDCWNNDGAKHIDRGTPFLNKIRNMERFPLKK